MFLYNLADMPDLMVYFNKSVHDLADKLPQWGKSAKDRSKIAATASLFEECGEICGLVSKYQTRKIKGCDLWTTKFEHLIDENFKSEIIKKFTDESGDLLWVLVAATYSIMGDSYDICDKILNIMSTEGYDDMTDIQQLSHRCILSTDNNENNNDSKLCTFILSEIMYDIYIIHNDSICYDDNDVLIQDFNCIVMDVCAFLTYLRLKYNISLKDILLFNMNKLGIRYDKNGNRIDGKL